MSFRMRLLMALALAAGPLLLAAVSATSASAGARVLPTPTALPEGAPLAAGSDGNVWYVTQDVRNAHRIGKISPDGVAQEFAVPPPDAGFVTGLTGGPDGNVWYAKSGDVIPGSGPFPSITRAEALIGRVTPSGDFTQFTLGDGRRLGGIAAGADGNLWFADPEQHRIGRITTAGSVTYFGGIPADIAPTRVTRGVDGNIWFWGRERQLSRSVGRITPDGTVREFALGSGFGAGEVAAGPDGAMWLVGRFGGGTSDIPRQLARLTPTGQLGVLPFTGLFFGEGYYQVRGLVAGPDGNLWLGLLGEQGEGPPSPIARLSPSGDSYTAFCVRGVPPDAYTPVVGPDGAIWAVAGAVSGGARLLRITTDTPTDPDCQPAGVVGLTVRKRQDVSTSRVLVVRATCSTPCATVTARGSINGRRRKFHGRQIATLADAHAAYSVRLRSATHKASEKPFALRLKIPAKGLRRLRSDLRGGGEATARIVVTGTTDSGGRIRAQTTRVSLTARR